MCGIAGFLDTRRALGAAELTAVATGMADRIRYRGPDDAGTWVDAAAGIALAHRRLSILDLSPEGHQPMVSADGRYVLSYNGEIYNFLELRQELEARSHAFRGHSDTEVLLAAVVEWGLVEALRRANGMFAAALWDRRDRTLHLFRDRFGEKPLYYGWAGGVLLFASELKALRAHPGFTADIDRGALERFLRNGWIPASGCIHRGFAKVVPGTVVSVRSARPADPGEVPFWSARDAIVAARSDPFRGDERDAVGELHRILRDSVRLRMVADVPLGAFLSGGVDSSTIVALMQAESSRPIKTFTVGFEREEFDEAPHARAVAAHLGTDHTELYVTERDVLAVARRVPELYDEPFSDSSQIPTYLVAELARRSVTVGLSGDGGDEFFAGYTRYVLGDVIWRAQHRVPYLVRRALARAVEASPPAAWAALERIAVRLLGVRPRDGAEALRTVSGFLRAKDAAALHARLLMSRGDSDVPLAPVVARPALGLEPPRGLSFVEQLMYWDTLLYLPDDILAKVDRATMSVSLEARVPFLDHRVFELAWRLPLQTKFAGGVTKRPLRAVLESYVPHPLVERPKRGFTVPLAEWLRGPLRAWAQDLLSPARLERQGLLDARHYETALAEHLSGARDRRDELWNALVFEAWIDSCAPAAGAVTPPLPMSSAR